MPVTALTKAAGPVARSALVTEVTATPVPGGSPDILRPRDAAPTVASVSDYSYLGCYTDGASPRILGSTTTQWTTFNHPSVCCEWCANQGTAFSYCGVEFASQCFCDTAMNSEDINSLAPSTECNSACVGNSDIECGAAARINIYSATIELGSQSTVSTTPAPAAVSGYTHVGCVTDSSEHILRQASFTEAVFMDAAYCCALCLNADNRNVLCGVEFSNECYCDGLDATSDIVSADGDCTMSCLGHGNQLCGGSFYMNLYSITNAIPSQSFTSSASTTSTSSITSDLSTSSPTNSPTHKSNPVTGLHGGAVAGVVVGSLAGVGIIAGLAFFLWRRRPSKHSGQQTSPPVELVGDTKYGSPGPHELDANLESDQPNTHYYELQADLPAPRQGT